MRLAFTGTRKGMTESQQKALHQAIIESGLTYENAHAHTAVHGACKGADIEFNQICLSLGIRQFEFFPSNDRSTNSVEACLQQHRTLRYTGVEVTLHLEQKPLDRNWEIVRGADILFAAPKEDYEVLRSGTWSTVRIARKLGVPYKIIEP